MKLIDRCLDLVYPPRCVFCDALLAEGEEYFCRTCGEKVPMAEDAAAVRRGTYVDRCAAPMYYEDIVRESFLGYKFRRSQRDRGYDQSEMIARELAKRLDLPCERLLAKLRQTSQQSRLDAQERQSNVLGAYGVKQGAAVRGRRILLVDDIVTTGSTMEECGRVLMEAGAEAVHGAAVAQTRL